MHASIRWMKSYQVWRLGSLAAKVFYLCVCNPCDVSTMEDVVDACNNHHRGKYWCCAACSKLLQQQQPALSLIRR